MSRPLFMHPLAFLILAVSACESEDDAHPGIAGAGGVLGMAGALELGGAGGNAGSGQAAAGSAGNGGEGGGGAGCSMPDDGLLAVFDVEGQTFRAQLLEQSAIDDAIALHRGDSMANIPNGTLVCEPADYNCGYSWHLDPEEVDFAEMTIEVCDGAPSYIEENCEDFVTQYCPWSAELVALYDCREEGCPRVSEE